VTIPDELRKSFRAFMDAGFYRLSLPPEMGGTEAPRSLNWAMAELILGANPAVWMYASGHTMARVLWDLGTPEQKHFAELAVEREWGATMVLTEPDAGSDVGAGRARAIQQPDGSWHIEGVKRFITSAEHDLAENIFHLVLARPEGAGPGTKGLSMFLVPKYHVDPETGELKGRNGVYVTNVEHKMGLKASTTCELTFGANPGQPAVGTLVGGVHDGIRQMFKVIEDARMMVGTKASATLSTGYLNALDFTRNRTQGADLTQMTDKTAPRVTILHHPDVRRALMTQKSYAEGLVAKLAPVLGEDFVHAILEADQVKEQGINEQRDRIRQLRAKLAGIGSADARNLIGVADTLVRKSVWIIGGDGWAYDIGFGGLDHVLASGKNVKVLVLDTEVYSNTGGQSSKSTPLGAVAKFASAGKTVPKKDIALQAIAYGNVYVARVAMGADPQQTLRAFREAEAYDGPSLIIAYSHCIAHGIEMRDGLGQQYRAVASGYWPLVRYDPLLRTAGGNPFLLDSPRPRIPLADYTQRELRYRSLANTHPAEAERLGILAQEAVDQRWDTYEEMATRSAHRFPADARKER